MPPIADTFSPRVRRDDLAWPSDGRGVDHPSCPSRRRGFQRPLLDGIERLIADELSRLDAVFSTWRDDSEISRFNALAGGEFIEVSDDLATVLECAEHVRSVSAGALNVGVGEIVGRWGFGAGAEASNTTPEASEAEAMRTRAIEGWRWEPNEGRLWKLDARVRLDASALAKGYAVDSVAKLLQESGCRDFLFELGGELRACGCATDGDSWRIGVESPDADAGAEPLRVLQLNNLSAATSGDYRNYRSLEMDGGEERVSHLMDPRTGRPAENSPTSVTVVHESAMWADAWATALYVLGSHPGLAVADSQRIATCFVTRERDGGYFVNVSPRLLDVTYHGPAAAPDLKRITP